MITDDTILLIADKLGIMAVEIFGVMSNGIQGTATITLYGQLISLVVGVIFGLIIFFFLQLVNSKLTSENMCIGVIAFLIAGTVCLIISAVIGKTLSHVYYPDYYAIKEIIGLI